MQVFRQIRRDPLIVFMVLTAVFMMLAAAAQAASPNTRGPIVKNPVPAAVATPAKGWTGIWVGAHLGYGVVQQRAVDSIGDAFNTFDVSTAQDAILYGVGVGFDVQLGKYVVVGALTDYSWTNSKRHIAIPVGTAIATDPAVGDVDIRGMWYAGGRAGWLAHPKALLFGSLGYTTVYGDTTLGDLAAASKPASSAIVAASLTALALRCTRTPALGSSSNTGLWTSATIR